VYKQHINNTETDEYDKQAETIGTYLSFMNNTSSWSTFQFTTNSNEYEYEIQSAILLIWQCQLTKYKNKQFTLRLLQFYYDVSNKMTLMVLMAIKTTYMTEISVPTNNKITRRKQQTIYS
jgi:hypothetical protein